jgi:KR domain
MVVRCRGVRTGEQNKVISKLTEMGVNIVITKMDVAELDEARELINLAESQAPLAIIFHLAMVLDDRLLLKQVCTKSLYISL